MFKILQVAVVESKDEAGNLPPTGQQQTLSIAAIQALKARSAQFYTSAPAEALQIATSAYELSRNLAAPAPALGSWTLANALFFLERYPAADRCYTEARNGYLAADLPLEAARAGVGHVFVLAYLGKAQQALRLAAEIETVLTQASQATRADRVRLGNLLMNSGVAHELLGQYEEALVVYERQAVLAESLDDTILLAQARHNQAYAFGQINAFTDAEQRYLSAEALFVQHNATAELVRLYMNYASLTASQGYLQEAKVLYHKAQAIVHTLAGLDQQAHLLHVYETMVDLKLHSPISEARLAALHVAQTAFAQHGPALAEGLTWLVLGEAYLVQRHHDAARAAFQQALALAQRGVERSLYYRAQHGLARGWAAQAEIAKAQAHYEAALQEIEQVRHDLRVDTFRSSFLIDKLIIYEDLTQLYLQQGQPNAALQVVERARSRLIREKLAFRLSLEAERLESTTDPTLRQLAYELENKLADLEILYQQQQVALLQQTHQTSDSTQTLGVAMMRLEEDVQTITRRIQRRQPVFSALATGDTSPLRQFASHLQAEQFLYYHLLHGTVCVFLIDGQGNCTHHHLADYHAVEKAQLAFATAIERMLELSTHFGTVKATRYLPALLADVQKHLYTLHQLLMAPVLPLLPPQCPLIVCPDGLLHYIPFHALYDGQHYLIEARAVSYVPSGTILDLCVQKSSTQQQALLFGFADQQLPAVTLEIDTIRQLFPGHRHFLHAEATTQALLANVANYRLLHIATHARFRADQPMLSAIALADRRLTLAEIAQLTLDLDLAVLSGCETGHGKLHGADLLSLAGGFMSAGTRSLVVSLWRVEDQVTARYMAYFYRALLAGKPRNEALRAAQLALLHTPTTAAQTLYQHPAYWAPFILIGAWHRLEGLTP